MVVLLFNSFVNMLIFLHLNLAYENVMQCLQQTQATLYLFFQKISLNDHYQTLEWLDKSVKHYHFICLNLIILVQMNIEEKFIEKYCHLESALV